MGPLVADHRQPCLSAEGKGQVSVIGRKPEIGVWSSADGHGWAERPSLEHQHAFDLCTVETRRIGGPVALFAGSPFYTRELLKRLDGCEPALSPVGRWRPSLAGISGLLGPEVEHVRVRVLERLDLQAKAAIWAEPEQEEEATVLERIGQVLSADGTLYVIVSGWPTRFLPHRRRSGDRPSERPIGLGQTLKWLRRGGYALEALHGFQGPESIFWGSAFRLMERLGRGDLADRCHFKMRAQYTVKGWQAGWALVALAVARKQ